MIEALKEEEIVNKVGGRFKLSTLIQKRLVALNSGARPLVDFNSSEKMEVVVPRDSAGQDLSRLIERTTHHGRSGRGGWAQSISTSTACDK